MMKDDLGKLYKSWEDGFRKQNVDVRVKLMDRASPNSVGGIMQMIKKRVGGVHMHDPTSMQARASTVSSVRNSSTFR